jgi:putative ABC transport system ATP-binding protein
MSSAAVASSTTTTNGVNGKSSTTESNKKSRQKSKAEDAAANRVDDSLYGEVRLRDTDVLNTDEDVVMSMKNVHKTYLLGVEGIPALRGVSVTIRKGEFVVVFGTSGGGKTTMLNLIGTIDKPTKGEMFLCGHRMRRNCFLPLDDKNTLVFLFLFSQNIFLSYFFKILGITDRTPDALLAEIRLKKMGFVFQTFNLLGALTAQENVEMPMVLLGDLSAAERSKRAVDLLTTVGLSKRLDHFPSQLSGGEQQRVTIARAIANRPELLLLDEPTGDLDSVNGAIVMDLLTKLHDRGLTLVMVTHDVHLKNFADRVVWMRDGKISRIDVNSAEAKRTARDELAADLAAHRAKVPKAVSRTVEIRRPEHYNTDPTYDEDAKPADMSFAEIDAIKAAGGNAAAPAASSSSNGKKKKKKSKSQQQRQETIVQIEDGDEDDDNDADDDDNFDDVEDSH